MTTSYEVRSGGSRSVAVREANSAAEAVLDYVRSLGCREDEITRLGTNTLAWRGAVYTAVPAARDA